MTDRLIHADSPATRLWRRSLTAQEAFAGWVTSFAGTMWFLYIHFVFWFGWMTFAEVPPWNKLTLVVSLEAIILSTLVMIGQNRQARFQQIKAEHDYVNQVQLLQRNTDLTEATHSLTSAIHALLTAHSQQ